MAKKPKPGQCIHCLQYSQHLTWDHVFPQAWYPDDIPANTEKWKVPACRSCNNTYSRIEEDLLVRFGLCLDPSAPESKGITDKVLRSVNPDLGRNEQDSYKRHMKRQRLLREIMRGNEIPMESIYPGFGIQTWHDVNNLSAVSIPAVSVHKLNEKIVKGVTFIETGKTIAPPYIIEFFALTDEGAQPVQSLLDRFGKVYAKEPGIVVVRAEAQDDEDRMAALFSITIWGRFRMHASVTISLA